MAKYLYKNIFYKLFKIDCLYKKHCYTARQAKYFGKKLLISDIDFIYKT